MHESPRTTPPFLTVLHLTLDDLHRPFQLDPTFLVISLPQVLKGRVDERSDFGGGKEVGEGVVAAAVEG
jgi:hypothetical protein